MKALTVWQPWASLIIIGAKPYEWRCWHAPHSIVGQRIVIHAGVRRVVMGEVEDLIYDLENGDRFQTSLDAQKALPLLRSVLAGETILPTGAGLGTALLGTPRPASEITTREADRGQIDEQKWGWPLSEIKPFAAPVPIRGAQGFWNWPDAAEMEDAA